jgi:hypothetical protein
LRPGVQVLAHHDRVGGNQRRFPEDLPLFELAGRGYFQAIQVFRVVGGDIDLFVGDRQRVDLVAAGQGALENPNKDT